MVTDSWLQDSGGGQASCKPSCLESGSSPPREVAIFTTLMPLNPPTLGLPSLSHLWSVHVFVSWGTESQGLQNSGLFLAKIGTTPILCSGDTIQAASPRLRLG